MRYLVEVPATFELEIQASSHEQARDFADEELARVLALMGVQSEVGSPEQCISLYTRIAGPCLVTSESKNRTIARFPNRRAA